MSVYGIWSYLSPRPLFPFFFSCYQLLITLLSCCWVCLYFSSFLFAAIILLLEVPSCFISWNIQVSMSVYGIWSHLSPRPYFSFSSAAISFLLRFCRVVGYVYIFALSCLLRLFYCLKFPRVLYHGIFR